MNDFNCSTIEHLSTILTAIDEHLICDAPEYTAVREVEAMMSDCPPWLHDAARHTGASYTTREALLWIRSAISGGILDLHHGRDGVWSGAAVAACRCIMRIDRVDADGIGDLIVDVVSDAMERSEKIEAGLAGLGVDAYPISKVRTACDHLLSAWSGLGINLDPYEIILPVARAMLEACLEEIDAQAWKSIHTAGAAETQWGLI